MKYEVTTSRTFEKEFKRLVNKYPSLDEEIDALIQELETNPTIGTPLKQNCYKIRLSIASKGKGKSGGGRVITYVVRIRNAVVLLTIYDIRAGIHQRC
jgi:mRNA-degrading endonuclease RelE of RelBE toxin-antitoxin system